MPNTLFLALQGPLQSWGERGRWSVRDSAPFPTKSGIIGLLGCALGWADDSRLAELGTALEIGVRADRSGVSLTDYHTITSGVLEASGKIKRNTSKELHTELSWRDYLCDAVFLVAIQGPEELLQRCAEAARQPVWPPYLGRKSCPMARPLYEGSGDYASLHDALERWPRLISEPADAPAEPLLAELPAPFGQGLRRSDVLVSRSRRHFAYRSVRQVLVDPPTNQEETPCSSRN